METVSRRLGLDRSQRSRVNAILQDQKSRRGPHHREISKNGASRTSMAVDRDIDEIRSASMKSLSRVLTHEQFEHFKTDIAAY